MFRSKREKMVDDTISLIKTIYTTKDKTKLNKLFNNISDSVKEILYILEQDIVEVRNHADLEDEKLWFKVEHEINNNTSHVDYEIESLREEMEAEIANIQEDFSEKIKHLQDRIDNM